MGTGDPSGVMGKISLFTLHFLQGLLGSLIYTAPVCTVGFSFGAWLGPSIVHFILKAANAF